VLRHPKILMQKFTSSLLIAVVALANSAVCFAQSTPAAGSEAAQTVTPPAAPRARVSPHETISTVVGDRRTGNRVTIVYGRPYAKDPKTAEIRKIWGGLVPWDKANRLGADEATLFITQQPIEIGGTTISAGAYTLYLVPSLQGATKLAFSSSLGKWGVPVDEKSDVARVELKKQTVAPQVDQLTIAVENDQATGGGVLRIVWEDTQFSVPFTVKKAS
jgi:hypothetical protein